MIKRVRNTYRSPNYSSRNGRSIDMIVIHHTGPGSYAGIRSWLCNPASRVSCHDLIGKPPESGIYYCDRLVPLRYAAWHAGRARWDVDGDGRISADERMINSRSIGIELVNRGDGKDPWPDEQIRFAARQVRRYMRRFGIRPRNIVDHELVSLSGKVDLKSDFPAARFMYYVEHGPTARVVGNLWAQLRPALRRAGKRIKWG